MEQPANNKTAVVYGGTGLVGRELISLLLSGSDYEKIVAVVRKNLTLENVKLKQVLINDFDTIDPLKDQLRADAYFCCIGTTIKTAGSKEAFLKVDLDIPVQIAKLAEALSVPNMVVISSVGADEKSANFYLRTKGEMEKAVREAYKGKLRFVRPSLLMGNRQEFRFGEKASVGFMKAFGWMFAGPLKKYRGIYATDVAKVMIKLSHFRSDKIVYESDELLYLKSDKTDPSG